MNYYHCYCDDFCRSTRAPIPPNHPEAEQNDAEQEGVYQSTVIRISNHCLKLTALQAYYYYIVWDANHFLFCGVF